MGKRLSDSRLKNDGGSAEESKQSGVELPAWQHGSPGVLPPQNAQGAREGSWSSLGQGQGP